MTTDQKINGDPKPPPLLVAIVRDLIAADVPTQCADAFTVGVVIGELQDRCRGRAVGFYIGQLAKLAGLHGTNPRRIRRAIKYLTDNGHADAEFPGCGTRQQTIFHMKLKGSDASQFDCPEQLTPYENEGCEDVTPVKTDIDASQIGTVTPVKTDIDASHIGTLSTPILSTPILPSPNTPPNPLKGELFDSGKTEKQKSGKPSKTPDAEIEAIYAAYPRRVAKAAALKAISKATQTIPFAELLEAVTAYARATAGSDPQFLPYPATWFNGQRWLDDRTTWKTTTKQARDLSGGAGVTHDPTAKETIPGHGKM